ncbi:hypothetical protein SLS58_005987 [Diplodia intermedia]|uniref:DUF7587 domain-containing protein n=1 Tax=Diplodia intermedia TaxID=856260 RepID=A0ABR3TP78_9PEZI
MTERIATQDTWFLGQLLRARDAADRRRQAPPESPNDSPLAGRSSIGDNSILLQLVEAAKSESSSVSNGMSSPTSSSQESTSTVSVKDEDGEEEEEEEDHSNASDPPTPYRPAQTSIDYAPAPTLRTNRDHQPAALLYRVYHDASGGLNSPTGFRAGLFSIPGQSLAPAPPTSHGDSASILPVFVSWHLWHHSVSSPFISLTDSLIMALHKARQAEASGLHPHISVIDAARAANSNNGNNGNGNNSALFPAHPLVAAARRRGLVPGMRYRGHREVLAWGAIGRDAVVRDIPLALLRSLSAADIGVADLLGLDDIDPAPAIASIRKALLRQEVAGGAVWDGDDEGDGDGGDG